VEDVAPRRGIDILNGFRITAALGIERLERIMTGQGIDPPIVPAF
jgi:hypothetical protein